MKLESEQSVAHETFGRSSSELSATGTTCCTRFKACANAASCGSGLRLTELSDGLKRQQDETLDALLRAGQAEKTCADLRTEYVSTIGRSRVTKRKRCS